MNYEGTELITALNEALAHKRGEIVFPSKTLSNDGLIDRAEILKHRCKVAVEAFENYDDLPNCDYAYVVPVKYIEGRIEQLSAENARLCRQLATINAIEAEEAASDTR